MLTLNEVKEIQREIQLSEFSVFEQLGSLRAQVDGFRQFIDRAREDHIKNKKTKSLFISP